MTDKYRVAVIGLGRIGAQLEADSKREKPCTHLGSWLAHNDRCEVVGICDTDQSTIDWVDEELPDMTGKGWGITSKGWAHEVATLNDYEDLLNKTHPDIVSIATPDETHLKAARVAMRYDGVKLVFLEKPIATTVEHAQLIIDSAREFKVKLAINHTRRWDPIWQAAAKLCSEQQPLVMNGYFTGDKLRDGVHMADLINWFQPEKSWVHHLKSVETNYLLFEVDLFWHSRRLRITSNGLASKMYLPFDSQNYEGIKELAMTCQVTRHLYPESSMYLATKQLLDILDVEAGKGTGVTDPFCTGEQGKKALELALTWD